ncbi:MAG TPA: FecR domain-containing protein [Polyangiales bacterium]
MADPQRLTERADELTRLVDQMRRAEAPALDGARQYEMVGAALRQSRAPMRLAPRITRYAVGLAAALLMGLLGARAFEYAALRLTTSHLELGPHDDLRRVWLRSGDALALAPGSAVDVLSENGPRRELRITRGAVLCDVKRLARGEGFEVLTPHANVRVRGTVFSVRVDERHTAVQVHEGTVYVAGRALHAGERWSSLPSAPTRELAVFWAEVRAALAARGGSVPVQPKPVTVEPLVSSVAAPAEAVVRENHQPRSQERVVEPPPPRTRRPHAHREPSPLSPEAAEQMLREGRAEQLLGVLDAQPSEPAYARVYADALRATGDFDRAILAYEALLDRSQGSLRMQAGYAAAQLAQGPLRDPLRALRAIGRSALIAPSSPLRERASVLRIDALMALGRHTEARAAAREYLEREPNTEASARLRRLLESDEP